VRCKDAARRCFPRCVSRTFLGLLQRFFDPAAA